MRKALYFLLIVLLVGGMMSLTGCIGGNGEQDEALVGQWVWDGDSTYVYDFNSDGTGQRGGGHFGVETFTWSTSGDELRINRDQAARDEIRNERWNYTISGDVLTIESRQEAGMIFSYTRR